VSLIIPALDEADAIGPTLRELPWHLLADCIVVDNGSTDATAEEARSNGACVILEPRRGYGQACHTGARAANRASEVLAFIDGDGSCISSDLVQLAAPVLAGEADFVIESRISGTREPGSMLLSQIFAAWLTGTLIRWRLGLRYTDMGPMRVISRTAFESMNMSEMSYGWNIEMQMRAAQRGLRILEIPVPYHCRTGGASKVAGSLRGTLRAGLRIVATFCRVAARRHAAHEDADV
jgi:glycosyltransferase involved in cell wall biosynthesis